MWGKNCSLDPVRDHAQNRVHNSIWYRVRYLERCLGCPAWRSEDTMCGTMGLCWCPTMHSSRWKEIPVDSHRARNHRPVLVNHHGRLTVSGGVQVIIAMYRTMKWRAQCMERGWRNPGDSRHGQNCGGMDHCARFCGWRSPDDPRRLQFHEGNFNS